MNTEAALDLLLNLCKKRLTFIDVGARWGVNPKWSPLNDKADFVCFEPDPVECARLQETSPSNIRYIPTALYEFNSSHELYVTKEPACSSFYEPLSKLVENFPCLDIISVQQKLEIPCKSLDTVMAEEGIAPPCAIKLDTQGSELPILKGGISTLKDVCLIETEVEFNELYHGQSLFCDLDRFLRDQGFVLWRLENVAHYAPEQLQAANSVFMLAGDPNPSVFPVAPNGQLFWSVAFYVRSEYPLTGAVSMNLADAAVPALLAGLYGFWDLALELIRKTDNPELHQELRSYLIQ